MNAVAVETGSVVLYWSAVFIAIGIAAGLALTRSVTFGSSSFFTSCPGVKSITQSPLSNSAEAESSGNRIACKSPK